MQNSVAVIIQRLGIWLIFPLSWGREFEPHPEQIRLKMYLPIVSPTVVHCSCTWEVKANKIIKSFVPTLKVVVVNSSDMVPYWEVAPDPRAFWVVTF